jgi:uncharacterized protein
MTTLTHVGNAADLGTSAARPVDSSTRLDVLDVLRGAAIFGILIYNIGALSGSEFVPGEGRAWSGWDHRAAFLLEFFVQGKFYSLFSFLFGIGFAVFIERASQRGVDAVRLFRRRLLGLMLIALVHTTFIWFGDILLTYSLLGFLLVPFVRRSDVTVLHWAIGMLMFPIALYAVLLVIVLAFVPAAPEGASRGGELPAFLARAIDSFQHGSYADVVRGNLAFTVAGIARRLILMFFPRMFGMFLLGLLAARRGVFADAGAHRPLLRRVLVMGLAVGIPCAFVGAWLGDSNVPRMPTPLGLVEVTAESIGTPALSLAYAAGLTLMFMQPIGRRVLLALAPVGRTALSNYLLHSIVGVLVFYGIGFGLFGTIALVPSLLGAAAFFAVEMMASRWWLRVADFGPAEWIWRQFTYRRRFPLFRRETASA